MQITAKVGKRGTAPQISWDERQSASKHTRATVIMSAGNLLKPCTRCSVCVKQGRHGTDKPTDDHNMPY